MALTFYKQNKISKKKLKKYIYKSNKKISKFSIKISKIFEHYQFNIRFYTSNYINKLSIVLVTRAVTSLGPEGPGPLPISWSSQLVWGGIGQFQNLNFLNRNTLVYITNSLASGGFPQACFINYVPRILNYHNLNIQKQIV